MYSDYIYTYVLVLFSLQNLSLILALLLPSNDQTDVNGGDSYI